MSATYYSDVSPGATVLGAIWGMPNAEFITRWPGVRGHKFDGYQMLVGRANDGQILPVTRRVFRKPKPSNHKCTARCLNAKCSGIAECECECGGKNHGRGLFTRFTEAA